MVVLCLYCVCYYEPDWGAHMWKDTTKKILLLNSTKSIFLFSVTSWYNKGAPRPRHGPKSAHFHCDQQGWPLYTLHCGAHCKAVGACPETTRLQQGPHGHMQQRRCCCSSAAVRPVAQVWLLYSNLTSLKTFRITCPDHDYVLPDSITPIFTLSSVSGESLDLLKVFFNVLPPLSNSKKQEELMQQLTEFQVGPWKWMKKGDKCPKDLILINFHYRWMRSTQCRKWGQ